MVATLCLFTCALLTAQPAEPPEWLITPRLGRGQELVYSGTVTEKFLSSRGVECVGSYRLESTVFILETTAQGMGAALLTVLEQQALRSGPGSETPPRSVRLEQVRITPEGRVLGADGRQLLIPLDGPATVECGALVEVPRNRVRPDHVWSVDEPGRPPRTWEVAGTEIIQSTTCLKLVGEQKSGDWDAPRADRPAWHRRDTVWIAPAAGIAFRVERLLEHKEPARSKPTHTSLVRYDLLSQLTYPGTLFRDRQREIWQARRFREEVARYLGKPAEFEPQLDALRKRIAAYQDRQSPVEPYCKAIQHVKQRIEAARRGEVSPEPVVEETPAAPPAVAALDRLAPDFVATSYTGSQAVRLHNLFGRPILLVFFNPRYETAREALLFAKESQRQGVTVLGLSVLDDAAEVRKQHAELKLTFPVLVGSGLKATFGVDATPRVILLDSEGMVRGAYTGWGTQTPGEIGEELDRCLHPSPRHH